MRVVLILSLVYARVFENSLLYEHYKSCELKLNTYVMKIKKKNLNVVMYVTIFKVVYIDGGTTNLDLTIFNNTESCGDPCDFHTLLNNTLPYTDVNYEQECYISSSNTYSIPWLDESRTTSLPLLFVR